MDQGSTLNLLVVAIAILSVTALIQCAFLIGLLIGARRLFRMLEQVQQKIEPVLAAARASMEEARSEIHEVAGNVKEATVHLNALTARAGSIAEKAEEIVDLGRLQVVRVNDLMEDVVDRVRSQLDRAETVAAHTLDRYDEVTDTLYRGLLRPLREINGILAGLNTAVAYLFRNKRTNVSEATQDDEMFI
jgi:hypothetical protein